MKYIYLLFFLLLTTSIQAQNVGIGQAVPASKLDINGGLTVGSNYSGNSPSPTDGAIFEGKVGIGTTQPKDALHVNGKGYILGNGDVAKNSSQIDLAIDDNNSGLESSGNGKLELYTDSNALVKLDGLANNNASGKDGLIFNDQGGNFDLRIAGDTSEGSSYNNLLRTDADSGFIGFKMSSPRIHYDFQGEGDRNGTDTLGRGYIGSFENTSEKDNNRDGVLVLLHDSSGYYGINNHSHEKNNFLTFVFNGLYTQGTIEGNPSTDPGISFTSGGADYAEWLEKKYHDENIQAGDIVAIKKGKITKNTSGPAQLSVVSDNYVVLGNVPSMKFSMSGEKSERIQNKRGDQKGYASLDGKSLSQKGGKEKRENGKAVSFMGQVEIKVKGKVDQFDYIIPSGEDNGVGTAVSPENISADQSQNIVGIAWEQSHHPSVKKVNCFISQSLQFQVPTSHTQTDDLRALKKELDQQKQRNKQLERKIEELTKRMKLLEKTQN